MKGLQLDKVQRRVKSRVGWKVGEGSSAGSSSWSRADKIGQACKVIEGILNYREENPIWRVKYSIVVSRASSREKIAAVGGLSHAGHVESLL